MNLFINEKFIGGRKTTKQTYKYSIDKLNKDFNSIETMLKPKLIFVVIE